jgi:hypothetical protein
MLTADINALILYVVHDKDAQKTARILHYDLLSNGKGKILSIAVKRGVTWTKFLSWKRKTSAKKSEH